MCKIRESLKKQKIFSSVTERSLHSMVAEM